MKVSLLQPQFYIESLIRAVNPNGDVVLNRVKRAVDVRAQERGDDGQDVEGEFTGELPGFLGKLLIG